MILSFKDAFEMLKDLHEQNGDRSIVNMKEEFELGTRRYNSYKQYDSSLSGRTDISQDMKWEVECWSETLKVLFQLMGKI